MKRRAGQRVMAEARLERSRNKLPRASRFVWGVVVLLIVTGSWSLYVLFEIFQEWRTGLAQSSRPSVVIVMGDVLVNGQPGVHLHERLDHALELYRSNLVESFVLTGGGSPPESRASRKFLIDNGVDEHLIYLEDRSCSTEQNVQFAVEVLRQKALNNRPVTVLTNGFHLKRALLYAREYGLTVQGVAAPSRAPRLEDIPSILREIAALTVRPLWTSPPTC